VKLAWQRVCQPAGGGWHLLLGELADITEGVLPLDVYRCPKCRRVEFFDLDLSLPER
jgi:hypothetical protein